MVHVDVWQKPTQYCKAIILQLKINKLKRKKHPAYITLQGRLWDHITSPISQMKLRQAWDLEDFAATLAPGHTSPQATKYKETVWD